MAWRRNESSGKKKKKKRFDNMTQLHDDEKPTARYDRSEEGIQSGIRMRKELLLLVKDIPSTSRNRIHVAKRLGAFEAKRGCDLIRIQGVGIVSDKRQSKTTCLNSKGLGVSSSYSVCCSGVVLQGEDVSLPSQRYE